MPNYTEFESVNGPDEGPVIRRAALAHRRAADACREDARLQADQLLQQARAQAVQIQSEAVEAGLFVGIQAALTPLLELAATLVRAEADLTLSAMQRMRDSFGDVLATAPALKGVLDMVLAERWPEAGGRVRMTIPPGAADCMDDLHAYGAVAGVSVALDVGDEPGRIAIECAGHYWEAHVEDMERCTSSRLQVSYLQESDGQACLARALRKAADAIEP